MYKILSTLFFIAWLSVGIQAQDNPSKSGQSLKQIEEFVKEAHENKRRITVQAKILVLERVGERCVYIERIRKISGTVTNFSDGQSFTLSEYRGFAPFMESEGGNFNVAHTICFSKVVAVKRQNQFLRVLRDTGETAGFVGFSAAALPAIPVMLVLAKAGKIDW